MQEVINDASGLSHYLWHIHTRMNWGEPWGKAMREGMPEYRFKNQEYFRRNLFPRMLGWFQLRNASESLEATTLDDIEWVMAKCAGFDAGCAIATSIYALKTNGQTEQMLTAIREWEKARFSNAFSEEQLQRMRDTRNEFHLESSENGSWKLFPVYFSPLFLHRWQEQQPGQPLISVWEIENSFEPQHLRFILRVNMKGNPENTYITNPSFQINNYEITFPVKLKPSQYLVCEDYEKAFIYDMNWNLLQIIQINSKMLELSKGRQKIEFQCEFECEPKPDVEIRFKNMGESESVQQKM